MESRYFPLHVLPDSTLPKHVERVQHSAAGYANVVFHVQDTPPGLQVLGYR